MAGTEDSPQGDHAVINQVVPRDCEGPMTRALKLAALAVVLVITPVGAQLSIPEIPYDAVDPIKLPDNIYLGEAVGVATNSKGNIFVYTRTGTPFSTLGTRRTFSRGGGARSRSGIGKRARSRRGCRPTGTAGCRRDRETRACARRARG